MGCVGNDLVTNYGKCCALARIRMVKCESQGSSVPSMSVVGCKEWIHGRLVKNKAQVSGSYK